MINDKALKDIESNPISSIHNQFHVTPMKQHEAMNISNAHTKVKTVTLATIHNHESKLRDCCHPNNTFVNKCDKMSDMVSNQHGAVHISNSYTPNVVPETIPNLTHFPLTNKSNNDQCLRLINMYTKDLVPGYVQSYCEYCHIFSYQNYDLVIVNFKMTRTYHYPTLVVCGILV